MQFFMKLKPGVIGAWFLILYNGGRFIIDFLRTPTLDLGIISMGQLLCLVFGAFGVFLLICSNKKV